MVEPASASEGCKTLAASVSRSTSPNRPRTPVRKLHIMREQVSICKLQTRKILIGFSRFALLTRARHGCGLLLAA